jgi:sulfate transport system ATP-binding protein
LTLTIDGVAKRFGRFPALAGVSLEVRTGEFLALLGPSGSGKTTLLRVLAGLDRPDAGRVMLDGADFLALTPRERRVGLVFQQYALFRHMTVARNIAFGLEVRPSATRPSRAAIAAKVEELLALAQIADLGGRYPAQLSGGQRQRVAVARALAVDPALLLLDEPFGALDAQVRRNLRVWLRELHVRMGLTSVFVTHDQDEAIEMADRVAVLSAGRLQQVDRPERLYANPATPFVHAFLGETSRLPSIVQDGVARIDLVPSAAIPTSCRPGRAFALVRSHEIGLLPGPGPARVASVHAAGPLTRVHLRLGELGIDVLRQPESWVPSIDETCELDLSRATIYPLEAP